MIGGLAQVPIYYGSNLKTRKEKRKSREEREEIARKKKRKF